MCGILGMVGTRWRSEAVEALRALKLRGPDEQTLTDLGPAVFAHTRLAVIDLAGGHQPMQTADRRFTIVFNGEIYNAPELRHELEAAGERFQTDHSDTEVLLLGYRAWGENLLAKLDGMFAFAVWDAQSRELFAARDRLGIKPFMYAALDDGLIFASTLAPFLALTDFPRRLDPEALRDYLAFQTPLAPQTFLRDVRQLPPAHALHFRESTRELKIKAWWQIPPAASLPLVDLSGDELLERTDAVLRTSVRRQMAADVPLGAFLSGGIDSSLMAYYLSEASSRPLETFCLKFAEQAYDESAHAAEVARALGCQHHVLEAPSLGAEALIDAIQALDQPLADPAYVMTHALSALTRQHVTVAISGDGGDELFGGYPRFRETAAHFPASAWQSLARRGVDAGILPASLLRRTLHGREMLHYRRVEMGPWPGRKSFQNYLQPQILSEARPERTLGLWLDLLAAQGGQVDSDALMRADLWTYLSENCLTKTDRASMAHSLEVRVPMLGQPVVDFALGLDARTHLQEGGKSLLTGLAKRKLPACVWNRQKHGFSVPLQALFNGAWQEIGQQVFAGSALPAFLKADQTARLWQDARVGRASRRLAYTFLVLLIWLDGKQLSFEA